MTPKTAMLSTCLLTLAAGVLPACATDEPENAAVAETQAAVVDDESVPVPRLFDVYVQLFTEHAQCVAVGGASPLPGAPLIAWDCNGGDEQAWLIEPFTLGSSDELVFRLRRRNSDMCIGVSNGSHSPGARLVQWPCSMARNHFWRESWTPDDDVKFINVDSGLFMKVDVRWDKPTPYPVVQAGPGANETFHLYESPAPFAPGAAGAAGAASDFR